MIDVRLVDTPSGYGSGVAASGFELVTTIPNVSISGVSSVSAGDTTATLTLSFTGDMTVSAPLAVKVKRAAQQDQLAADLTTGNVRVFTEVAGLTAHRSGYGEVTLRWTALGDSAVSGYDLRFGAGTSPAWNAWAAVSGAAASTTSHVVRGLRDASPYSFQLRATYPRVAGGDGRRGPATAAASVEVLPAPAAPALQVTPGRNRLTASWAPVLHATSYLVEWKGPTEQYSHDRRGIVTGTTYVLQSLAADTQYTMRVRARRTAAADGPHSSEVSARTEEAPVGVCSRTAAVRDAILARIAGVTDCAQVYRTDLNRITGILRIRNASGLRAGDFAGLGGVTLLRLDGNPNLTSLPTGVFAGLSGLATLRLDGAGLSTLPTGAFDGLSGLRELRIHGNRGSPFTLDVEAERVGGYEVRARIDEAAPGPVQVTWTASGGSTATGTATIPAGARTSPPFGEAAATAVTVTLSDPVRSGVSEGTDDEVGAQTGFRLAVPDAGAAATISGSPCETERVVGRGAARPLVADCKLLLKIKDELRGTASLDWGGSTAIGSWRGVTVSGGRVTGLSITGAVSGLGTDTRLKGRIPARLAGLDGLTTLYLVGHRFSGGVPAELGRLTGLTSLTLRDNGLAGAVPAELAGLTRLTTLNLSDNDLTGGVPSALSGLTSLQGLDLSGNDLTGGIPSALSGLTSLAVLDLSGNDLSGGIPASLSGLTRLTSLLLNGNKLTGVIPEALGGLDIRALYLRGNSLTGCIPRALRSHASTINNQRLFVGGQSVALSICIAAPRSLTALAGDGRVTLRWNAPEDRPSGRDIRYRYRRSTDAGANWTDWNLLATTAAASKITRTVTGLTNNLTYTFEVRAEYLSASRPSNRATATPTIPAPLSLSATAGDRSIALAWTDPGDATLTGYEVSTDAGANWTAVAGSGPATAAHTLTGLVNGRAYLVRLRAVRGGVRGAAEGSREYALSGGGRLAPSGELGVRWDGGDGGRRRGVVERGGRAAEPGGAGPDLAGAPERPGRMGALGRDTVRAGVERSRPVAERAAGVGDGGERPVAAVGGRHGREAGAVRRGRGRDGRGCGAGLWSRRVPWVRGGDALPPLRAGAGGGPPLRPGVAARPSGGGRVRAEPRKLAPGTRTGPARARPPPRPPPALVDRHSPRRAGGRRLARRAAARRPGAARPDVHRDLEGTDPRLMVEDLGREHQLVHPGPVHEFLHPAEHGGGGSHRRAGALLVQHPPLVRGEPVLERIVRRGEGARPAPPEPQRGLPGGRPKPAGLFVGLRREHVEPGHGVGLRELSGGLERAAVRVEGGEQGGRCEVRREGVGQPQEGGELRPVEARAQDPDGDVLAAARNGLDGLFLTRLPEVALELDHVPREVVRVSVQVSAQGECRALVRARGAPEAEVDAPRIERIEGAELLRDDEGRVVRKHDPARAHPDGGGPARDVADDDGGRRARDPRNVVMLGDPVPAVPERLRAPREVEGVAHGPGGAAALGDGREVENRERGHGRGEGAGVGRPPWRRAGRSPPAAFGRAGEGASRRRRRGRPLNSPPRASERAPSRGRRARPPGCSSDRASPSRGARRTASG